MTQFNFIKVKHKVAQWKEYTFVINFELIIKQHWKHCNWDLILKKNYDIKKYLLLKDSWILLKALRHMRWISPVNGLRRTGSQYIFKRCPKPDFVMQKNAFAEHQISFVVLAKVNHLWFQCNIILLHPFSLFSIDLYFFIYTFNFSLIYAFFIDSCFIDPCIFPWFVFFPIDLYFFLFL